MKRNAALFVLPMLVLALCLALSSCGHKSKDHDSGTPAADDDDSGVDDDAADDAATDDDSLPDDYVAPWPQSNVEDRDYDETQDAGVLRVKANAYDQWHLLWHQPYYGGSAETLFADDALTVPIAYGGWGDSCIWTGTFLGSQAMRYWVTSDPAAKQNAMDMVRTLDGFLHVTGRHGFIARYWAPQDSIIYGGDDWCDNPDNDRCHRVEEGVYAGDFWWGETSRDQYTGWFFGMAMAFDLVDDDATREMIKADVSEVLDELMANKWTIIDEAGQPTDAAPTILPPQQMSWLLIGYHMTGEDRFRAGLQKWLLNKERLSLQFSSITGMNRYAQYYGNNLGHTNWYSLLRLGKVYFSQDDYDFLLNMFETQIHSFTRLSHNPWFNGIHMGVGYYLPGGGKDAYYGQLVQDLLDFPNAPNKNYYLPARADFTMDPLSKILYDLEQQYTWLSDLIGGIDEQALYAFPIPQQCASGFMFQKNPFQFQECGADMPRDINPGVDYLVAYWLSSYHKFLKKEQ